MCNSRIGDLGAARKAEIPQFSQPLEVNQMFAGTQDAALRFNNFASSFRFIFAATYSNVDKGSTATA